MLTKTNQTPLENVSYLDEFPESEKIKLQVSKGYVDLRSLQIPAISTFGVM